MQPLCSFAKFMSPLVATNVHEVFLKVILKTDRLRDAYEGGS